MLSPDDVAFRLPRVVCDVDGMEGVWEMLDVDAISSPSFIFQLRLRFLTLSRTHCSSASVFFSGRGCKKVMSSTATTTQVTSCAVLGGVYLSKRSRTPSKVMMLFLSGISGCFHFRFLSMRA